MAEKLKLEVSDEIAIKIQGMNKWFGSFHVLRDIDLTVNRGERIVVCGPSGSGKSTLIRCVNALEEHQTGQIIVDGTELTSDIKNIDRIRSEVGMVFQHFNLFPHLSILCLLYTSPSPRDEQSSRMPSSASSIMVSSTSLIISGSSAEVGSSKSIIRGRMQSDRAIATRCC